MPYFPMMVDIYNKKVLIVGGGEEGAHKAEILRDFGARVTLIAPSVTARAAEIAEVIFEREFADADLLENDYALVVAATDNEGVNRRVSELAENRKIPVNVVDNAPLCTFIFPAIVKDRDVVCAASSGGKSPYITQYIKKRITEVLPEGIGRINDRMGELREKAKKEIPDKGRRREFLKKELGKMLGA